MRQILSLALILSCSIADNADVKRVKKGKKVKKEDQVKDLGPGPCHEPVHPLILQAKAKGIKSIPLKSMSEFRRLLDDCSKTGHKETVKQIKRADFDRDFKEAQYMSGWTSNHAGCVSMIIFYYYVGLITVKK